MTENEVRNTRSVAARMYRERFGAHSLSEDDAIKDTEHTIAQHKQILKLARETNEKTFDASEMVDYGFIQPGLMAPVVRLTPGSEITAEYMRFGFPQPLKYISISKGSFSDYLCNARSESVTEKPTFAEHVLIHRCILPVMGYWEGSVNSPERDILHMDFKSGLMYLAGIYKSVKDGATGKQISVCCILTQNPVQSEVKKVHDRMPVLIEGDRIGEWLTCGTTPGSVREFIAAQKTPLLAVVNRMTAFS